MGQNRVKEGHYPCNGKSDANSQMKRGRRLHSRKLTWKPKKGPIKTTIPPKGNSMGFHVSLGECIQKLGSLSRGPETQFRV